MPFAPSVPVPDSQHHSLQPPSTACSLWYLATSIRHCPYCMLRAGSLGPLSVVYCTMRTDVTPRLLWAMDCSGARLGRLRGQHQPCRWLGPHDTGLTVVTPEHGRPQVTVARHAHTPQARSHNLVRDTWAITPHSGHTNQRRWLSRHRADTTQPSQGQRRSPCAGAATPGWSTCRARYRWGSGSPLGLTLACQAGPCQAKASDVTGGHHQ